MNGVVDQAVKRNTTSVANRAEAVSLPRSFVDIRHGAFDLRHLKLHVPFLFGVTGWKACLVKYVRFLVTGERD